MSFEVTGKDLALRQSVLFCGEPNDSAAKATTLRRSILFTAISDALPQRQVPHRNFICLAAMSFNVAVKRTKRRKVEFFAAMSGPSPRSQVLYRDFF